MYPTNARSTRRAMVAAGLFLMLAGAAGCKVDQAREVATYRKVLDEDAPAVEYAPGEPLNLETALALANQHSETLGLRGEDYLQALIAQDRAASAFFPTVSLAPSYTIQQKVSQSSFTQTTAGNGGTGTTVVGGSSDKNHRFDVPVRAGWNAFNGFTALADYRAVGRTIEQRRALLLDAQATVLLDVAQIYYQVLRSEQSVQVLKSSLNVQEERLRDTRGRQKAGLARPLDIAQTEAQVAATRVSLIQAQSDVINGRSTLSNLIAADLGNGQLVDDAHFSPDLASLSELEQIAQRERQDLIAAQAAVQASIYEVQAAIGQYYPSITFNVTYFLYKETSPTDQKWNAILSANIPIFTGGQIEADVRTAWSILRQAKLNESATRRQIVEDVQIAYQNVKASYERLRELQVQVQAAQEALRQAEASYKIGSATNLDRLTAQDALLSAQLQLTSERFNLKIFHLDLLRALGRLAIRLPGEPANAKTRPTTLPTTLPTTHPAP